MDALFQTQSNELSTTTQKEKLFKDAERQWNTLSTEKGCTLQIYTPHFYVI